MKDLDIRSKTLKLVQEGAGNNLELISIGKDFLKSLQLRERMDKWDFIKLKSFCTKKETVFKLQRPPAQWEKIFVIYTLDKRLITRTYRELKKLNSPKINEPIKKWATVLNRTLSKEEIQTAKRYMKKMLTISSHKGNAN
jgi:hypothetical protein